jgi:geranylgeranyl pyrophosphate synthase
MRWQEKLAALREFYERSFRESKFVAEVSTSGSYAKKVLALARLGRRTPEEVEILCAQAEHLRRAFKIMDDLIDEDTIRDGEPAFWVLHGEAATIEQGAWYIKQSRELAQKLGVGSIFEQRLQEVISGAQLEVKMENPKFRSELSSQELWYRIVAKEAAFRRYLAEALHCSPEVVEAMYQDGIAAQMLDDGLSALYSKDGRVENSDEKLDRLTYMRAYGVSAEEAVRRGRELKNKIAPILGRKEGKNG